MSGKYINRLPRGMPADQTRALSDVFQDLHRDATQYQASGSGAVIRTVKDKLGEFVSVKDFGAVGDGATNDAAAIQAAVDSFTGATPVCIYLPPGDYYIGSSITIAGARNVAIEGAGNGVARILCDATNALVFNPSTQDVRVSLQGFDLVPYRASAGDAIRLNYPAPSGLVTNQVRIQNVDIYGPNLDWYFTRGVACINASNAIVRGCLINGKNGNPTTIPSAQGIYIENGYDYFITDCRFHFWQDAILLYDYAEGVVVTRCKVEYSDYAFRKQVVGSIGVTESLQIQISDSHLTARKRGILLAETKVYFLSNLHIQCRDDAASPIDSGSSYGLTSFVAIEVQGTQTTPQSETDVAVIENVSFTAQTVNNDKAAINGIVIEDCKHLRVRDSWIANCALGLWLQSGAEQCHVNKVRFIDCTANTLDDGTANIIEPPTYMATVTKTLTGGAATENVDFALPAGLFSAKPGGGLVFMSDPVARQAFAFYDYGSGSSSATNARCVVSKNDGSALAAESVRFSVLFFA